MTALMLVISLRTWGLVLLGGVFLAVSLGYLWFEVRHAHTAPADFDAHVRDALGVAADGRRRG